MTSGLHTPAGEVSIYVAVGPDGRCYVGQTRDIQQRIRDHRRRRTCPALREAFKQFGFSAFRWRILANVPPTAANAAEAEAIDAMNSLFPNGYNILGGNVEFGAFNEFGWALNGRRNTHLPHWSSV